MQKLVASYHNTKFSVTFARDAPTCEAFAKRNLVAGQVLKPASVRQEHAGARLSKFQVLQRLLARLASLGQIGTRQPVTPYCTQHSPFFDTKASKPDS